MGGAIVCFYVLSATLLPAHIGIGSFILFAVVTQMIASDLIDFLGLFGAMVRPVSRLRAADIGLLVIGLVITQVASQRSSVGTVHDPDQMRQKIKCQTPKREFITIPTMIGNGPSMSPPFDLTCPEI